MGSPKRLPRETKVSLRQPAVTTLPAGPQEQTCGFGVSFHSSRSFSPAAFQGTEGRRRGPQIRKSALL